MKKYTFLLMALMCMGLCGCTEKMCGCSDDDTNTQQSDDNDGEEIIVTGGGKAPGYC